MSRYQVVRYPVRPNPGDDSYELDAGPSFVPPLAADVPYSHRTGGGAPDFYETAAPYGGADNGFEVAPFDDAELSARVQNPFFSPPAINYESWWPREGCQVNPPAYPSRVAYGPNYGGDVTRMTYRPNPPWEDEADLGQPSCPACHGPAGMFLGALGSLDWFRCRDCGMDFSTSRARGFDETSHYRGANPYFQPPAVSYSPNSIFPNPGYPSHVSYGHGPAGRMFYHQNPQMPFSPPGVTYGGGPQHRMVYRNPTQTGVDRPWHTLESPFSGMACGNPGRVRRMVKLSPWAPTPPPPPPSYPYLAPGAFNPLNRKCATGNHDFDRTTWRCVRPGCVAKLEDPGQRPMFGYDPLIEADVLARERATGQSEFFRGDKKNPKGKRKRKAKKIYAHVPRTKKARAAHHRALRWAAKQLPGARAGGPWNSKGQRAKKNPRGSAALLVKRLTAAGLSKKQVGRELRKLRARRKR